MANNVVELRFVERELQDVLESQFHIRQPGPTQELIPVLDLPHGRIDPEKTSLRKLLRHRQQVSSACTSQLQHPCRLNGRWVHSEQCCDHRQPIGMRLRKGMAFIRCPIIRGRRNNGRVRHLTGLLRS